MTKILLVEDNPDIAIMVSGRLEVTGFEVERAANGEEAIQKVKSNRPDIVLMDLMLPKISGFDATRMIKFDDATKNIPIIILSALSDQNSREKAVQSGADSYFIKPFDLELLIVKIKSLTEKK